MTAHRQRGRGCLRLTHEGGPMLRWIWATLFGRKAEPAHARPVPYRFHRPQRTSESPPVVIGPVLLPFPRSAIGTGPREELTVFEGKWRTREAMRKFAAAVRAGQVGDAVMGDGEGI